MILELIRIYEPRIRIVARQFVSNRRAIQQIAPTGCQVVLALFFNKLRYASRFNLAAVFIQRA
ncbi:MAG: hypothetical protein OXE52_14085, partial [Chloroflexi bacterium]|nr:hypothetical protein [Chloroflexota bacterium]